MIFNLNGNGGIDEEEVYNLIGMKYDPITDIRYLKNQYGEWVNMGYAGLLKQYLYSGYDNEAGFTAYSGSMSSNTQYAKTPTIDVGEVLKISFPSGAYANGTAISNLVDLTNYNKIKFHYKTTRANTTENFVRVFITQAKSSVMTSVALLNLTDNTNLSKEGNAELDISALSGEYYIAFQITSSVYSANVLEVSNMYMDKGGTS